MGVLGFYRPAPINRDSFYKHVAPLGLKPRFLVFPFSPFASYRLSVFALNGSALGIRTSSLGYKKGKMADGL